MARIAPERVALEGWPHPMRPPSPTPRAKRVQKARLRTRHGQGTTASALAPPTSPSPSRTPPVNDQLGGLALAADEPQYKQKQWHEYKQTVYTQRGERVPVALSDTSVAGSEETGAGRGSGKQCPRHWATTQSLMTMKVMTTSCAVRSAHQQWGWAAAAWQCELVVV